MFRRASSLWKLSLMLLGLLAAAMLLIWVLTSWVLVRAFDTAGRAVVLDDIGEYEVLYARAGAEGIRTLFAAGNHERDQVLRIVSASGDVKVEVALPGELGWRWPDLSERPAPAGREILWHREAMPNGATLTIGRRRLADGAELWFGRTNVSDLAAIERVHYWITLTMAITTVLAVGPVIWFANRVLRPVHQLIGDAQHLVKEDATFQRLRSSEAIPELKQFAHAFNQSLDRVRILTEELEAANDQLAHELRTPLARIRGNVEHVLSRVDDPTTRESAVRAIAEIDRATNLVQAILSIRAGESRTLKLQLEPLSLLELVSEMCELYAAAAEEKGLELDVILKGSAGTVTGDRQRLQQALCNLLDNALAYTPCGGTVQVQLEFDPDNALMRVRDTGPGLSQTDQERIWRRFMRGSAASANTPGIGLGLSLVKAVANAHRGDAGGENRQEGGAEFWIRLPRAAAGKALSERS